VELEYPLIRQAIDIISVESETVNNVGFVKITSFNDLTATQFNSALQTFNETNVRALLIDLRNNRSDVYSSEPVGEMVNSLMGADIVAFTEHKGGVQRDFIVTDDTRGFPENIPILILADSSTSGAGELMAAVLKSYAGAQIIGTSTAGNAYLQQTQGLKDGSAIRLTVARIILASELDYAESGLIPDNEVKMEMEVDYTIESLNRNITDPQILKAFEIIETIGRGRDR